MFALDNPPKRKRRRRGIEAGKAGERPDKKRTSQSDRESDVNGNSNAAGPSEGIMRTRILSVLGLMVGLTIGTFATGANAATMSLNNGGPSQTLNVGDIGTFQTNHSPGSFSDDWWFQVGTNGSGSGAAVDVLLNILGLSFDNSNLFARIVDLTLGGTQVGVTTGPDDNASAFAANLIVGHQYAVRVSGDAVGTAGGLYNGSIQLNGPLPPAVVPVPPALLLFGSALTGLFCVGRRKKADTAA